MAATLWRVEVAMTMNADVIVAADGYAAAMTAAEDAALGLVDAYADRPLRVTLSDPEAVDVEPAEVTR